MPNQDQIAAFLDDLTHYDGYPPLSDAKLPIDPGGRSMVAIMEGDDVIALAATASHTQSDGSTHRELETAVRPVMRFPAFEDAILDASLPLVQGSASFSVWSGRSSLDTALANRGFGVTRILDFLVVGLPLPDRGARPTGGVDIRTFTEGDISGVVAVNAASFHGHREAAGLTEAEMASYLAESWFDEKGLLVAHSDGIAGFCWTKVHPNGDGEIFRIAVDPRVQGQGVGVTLLRAGFEHLAARPDVDRGVLWVDRSNTSANKLYTSIGLRTERSNREFSVGGS